MKITGLYKRGDVYWYKRQVAGRRKYVSLGTSDFAEAVAKAVEMRGGIEDEVANDQLSLARAEFLKSRADEVRQKTMNFYQYALGKLDPLAKKPIRSVKLDDFKKIVALFEREGFSDYSINTIMRGWKIFFNWCSNPDQKRIRSSPLTGLKFKRTGTNIRDEKFCTVEQRKQLIDNAPNDDLKFILFAGFRAGLRKLEIVEARRDWFDLEHKFIQVKKATKGNKRLRADERPFLIKDSAEKIIPIADDFLIFLTGYLENLAPLDFVLHPEIKHGKWEYRYEFDTLFGNYVKKQGMKWVTPHTMRHTFASLKAQAGMSLDIIAAWMGDSPEVVRKHYAHYAKHDEDINL